MKIVRLCGGGIGYKGNILNICQDISKVAKKLDFDVCVLPIFLVKKRVDGDVSQEIKTIEDVETVNENDAGDENYVANVGREQGRASGPLGDAAEEAFLVG
eukprot:CAMPEP_0172480440 /NCGR_PEP_ID=MMETSP1066-20121228/5546_1 /TAXON_ID=671091 /ORGANISM="Coscinodiscus wailesii, Strain CCMP2513" /LENGTH=100 /DNA_ID=CAMNT_0013241725 /DNA_START=349 /DNA_END=648 /DNA_ORIENTATION=-